MKTLYLIRGIPGSGKSTFAVELSNSLGINYYEADMYFYDDYGNYKFKPENLMYAHLWCQEHVEEELQTGNSVIVSNTSTTEKEINTYKFMAETHNATFVSLIVENRHGGGSVHDVPQDKLDQMRHRFSIKL